MLTCRSCSPVARDSLELNLSPQMNSFRSANYAIYFKVIFMGILLYPSAAERRVGEADKKIDDRRDKREREPGTVNRILNEVKRFGETIDPEAVAQTKRAWEEFEPDLKQAEEELIRAQDQMLAFGDNMKEVLTSAKNSFSETWERAAPGGGGWDDIGEGWNNLKRDGTEMAKNTLGDVLGDVANDVVGALETGLSEALSKGNVRAASELWRRVLESPGVQLLTKDRRIWEGTERAVRNYLNGFVTEESEKYVQRAVNATEDFTIHFAGLSQNIGKTKHEVFQEISDKMCHLQGAAQKLWPITKRTLPLLGYEEYIASAESVIKANILHRVTLTVSACALLGMNPRNDPFLMAVVVAFSLGHLTKDFAENLVMFFLAAFVDSSELDQMNTIDLVTEMMGGASSCKELGDKSFAFFEGVKGALASGDQDADVEDKGDPALRGRLSSEEHKLEKDARVLRYAIWVAAVVDHPRFSVDGLLLALGMALMLCGMALGACCREGLVRRRRRQPRGGEARKKIA